MRKAARFALCALLLLSLLLHLAPPRADAADNVFFTASNDLLLDLDAETMPFWQGDRLYVPYTVVSGTDLRHGAKFDLR